MSTLPTACPPSAEPPVNRCCTTRLQVVPQASSPHRAASAIRRSPGGSTPKSRRSMPLDPPLSATVTIAVSWRGPRRPADREGDSPGPPPAAATRGFSGRTAGTTPVLLTPKVTVHYLDAQAGLLQPPGDLLGHRHAAVLAAGAADREGHVLLPLALVPGQGHPQRRQVGVEEFRGAQLAEHVLPDPVI